MERITISNAVEILNELNQAMVAAYWDANDIYQKDTLFDILSVINAELNELAKLSIEDHNMGYEPVTVQFPACTRKVKHLQNHIDEWFPRTETAQNLHEAIAGTTNLMTSKFL